MNMRNFSASGGWVCSVDDLARLMKDTFAVRPRFDRQDHVLNDAANADLLQERVDKRAPEKVPVRRQCFGWETGDLANLDYFKSGHLGGTHALAYNFGRNATGAIRGASVVYVFNRYELALSAAESAFRTNLRGALAGAGNWGNNENLWAP